MRPADADLDAFRRELSAMFGWSFAAADTDHVAQILHRRAAHHGEDVGRYLTRLGSGLQDAERNALAEELTITETYFFRHREQFDVLATIVLPDRVRARVAAGQTTLRTLSVGCSSG